MQAATIRCFGHSRLRRDVAGKETAIWAARWRFFTTAGNQCIRWCRHDKAGARRSMYIYFFNFIAVPGFCPGAKRLFPICGTRQKTDMAE
jgi:hypothetical protein